MATTNVNWFRFDFNAIHSLIGMRIWNYNAGDSYRGMHKVVIEYSTTGGPNASDWTTLPGGGATANEHTFLQAPSAGDYTGFDINFSPISAKHVVFSVFENMCGDHNFIGSGGQCSGNIALAEVRFLTPEPSTLVLTGCGLLGFGCRRRRSC